MQHINPKDLKEKLANESGFFLLDVREDWEHHDFNIGGLNVPLSELILNAKKIPQDASVVVYCKKGVRSQIAIQRLEQKFGYNNLINLAGGINAWKKMVDQ